MMYPGTPHSAWLTPGAAAAAGAGVMTQLTGRGVRAICDCLAGYGYVKNLAFWHCNVGDEGVAAVCDLLRAATSVFTKASKLALLEITHDFDVPLYEPFPFATHREDPSMTQGARVVPPPPSAAETSGVANWCGRPLEDSSVCEIAEGNRYAYASRPVTGFPRVGRDWAKTDSTKSVSDAIIPECASGSRFQRHLGNLLCPSTLKKRSATCRPSG